MRLMAINLFLVVLVALGVGFSYWGKYWIVPAILIALIAFAASEFARQAIVWKGQLKELKNKQNSQNE